MLPNLCRCLVLLCLLVPWLAQGQTIHKETVVWDFVNGLYVRGVPIGAAGATESDQVFISTGPGAGTWRTIPDCPAPSGALAYNAATDTLQCTTMSSAALGTIGTLQASDGMGGFAAYAGSTQCNGMAGEAMLGLTPIGATVCGPISTSFSGHVVTTRNEPGIAGSVSLGSLSPGLLAILVSGGEASFQTVTRPAGELVDTATAQTLENKRVVYRPFSAPSNEAALTFNLSATDVVTISELSQDTTFANPTGMAIPNQLFFIQVKTTIPRALTWGTFWSEEYGFPLPASSTGGGLYDLYAFRYNSATGHMGIIFNVRRITGILPSDIELAGTSHTLAVVAGLFTPGNQLTTDADGNIIDSGVAVGSGGGGGGTTAAGNAKDIQYKAISGSGLEADSGNFIYNPATHTGSVQRLTHAAGGTVVTFIDIANQYGYLLGPAKQTKREMHWSLPDEDGPLCVKGGSCFTGSGGDFSSNTATSVDSEVVLFSGTGGKTGKRATGSGIAKLTSGVLSTVTAPGGTIVGDNDTQTLTNKTLDVEGTGNNITIVTKVTLQAAGCQAGVAGLLWDTPSSNPAVAACVAGTNTVKGVADFADGSNLSMQTWTMLPSDWAGNIDAKIKWYTSATSGSVVWQLATICVADAETDDPAFNTASTVTDAAKGTTNQLNDATISNLTATGCAAGELMHLKIFRDSAHGSDDLAATARLVGVELTMRRTQ